jgi:hypothetical protein
MTEFQKAQFRAFVFGMGSMLDLSGRSVMALPSADDFAMVGHDFQRVGDSIAVAVDGISPEIKAEEVKQLSLKLDV